ncbi:MAG TPA: adenylate/guanylate cyclase domain-containing protein [Candidatus Limnocylindrales bacterium]|jgi:class 3 adenylate cyclase
MTHAKSLGQPEEIIELEGTREDAVEIGDFTVARVISQPGWRWSLHMKASVGTEWCEAHHVGWQLSGRSGFELRDGTTFEIAPDDVFDIPPGHDGYTIGDEPAISIEWSGLRTWTGPIGASGDRVLVTLLMTDLVDSTAIATRLGDRAWRELLSAHYASVRIALDRYRGRAIDTTGDGLLATFDSPARALRCALAIRDAAPQVDLHVRVGVHVGEVEQVGDGVRGQSVHEVARVMSTATADEILASETARALASGSGLVFQDRGEHVLKGFEGPRRLYALVG